MAGHKESRKIPGFRDIYKKIRKEVPAPMRVEEPRKGKGHTYSKRDRKGWRAHGDV